MLGFALGVYRHNYSTSRVITHSSCRLLLACASYTNFRKKRTDIDRGVYSCCVTLSPPPNPHPKNNHSHTVWMIVFCLLHPFFAPNLPTFAIKNATHIYAWLIFLFSSQTNRSTLTTIILYPVHLLTHDSGIGF